jgi:hypothetical protein
MSISVSMNEELIPQDRTKGLAEGGARAAIGLLVAIGLVCLIVGAFYLSSLLSPGQEGDLGQFAGAGL